MTVKCRVWAGMQGYGFGPRFTIDWTAQGSETISCQVIKQSITIMLETYHR